MKIALTILLATIALLAGINLSTVAASDVPACEPIGKAEGESLYFCQGDYVACVWDPSPVLGAGVLTCEW